MNPEKSLRRFIYSIGGAVVVWSALGIADHTFGNQTAKNIREFVNTAGYLNKPERPRDKRSNAITSRLDVV